MLELVINNGTLVDPERNTTFIGNLGIKDGKLVEVTNRKLKGTIELEAKHKIVCPGFIDVHSHLDGCLSGANASALQGITTSIGGNCGDSPLSIGEFLYQQDQKGYPINQGELIGQSSTLREAVGAIDPYSPATRQQIELMCRKLAEAFEEGALGMSFGLEYSPGYTWEEILEVTKVAAEYNRIVPIHTNVTGPRDLEHLEEVIRLGEQTGAHIHVAHFVYQYGMGYMTEALDLIDEARGRGINISCDSGMYTNFATIIGSSVFDEDHIEAFGWDYGDIMVTTGKHCGSRLNRKLYELLRRDFKEETCICFTGVEEEIFEALSRNYMMVSSDSGTHPDSHPQALGTYPRFINQMVKKRKSMTINEAVRRCTLLPAQTFGLKDKGGLAEGMDGDLVIFDIDKIEDRADFFNLGSNPKPMGIDYVIVRGELVVNEGELVKAARPGRVIRGYK